MSKVKIFIKIGILIIIVIVGYLIFSNKFWQPVVLEEGKNFQSQQEIKEKTVLIIDSGEGEPKTFEAEITEGTTVLDLLKDKIEESNLILKTEIFDVGVMIKSIGDELTSLWLREKFSAVKIVPKINN